MNGLLFESGLFLGSLVLMSVSSFVLTVALERIGSRLALAEGLLGILAALGADAPEISSSFTALSGGHHELGLGVVLGSNIFNLAALLGGSALVAGVVRVGQAGALLNGAVSLFATFAAGALLLGWLPPWLTLLALALVVVPYVVIVALYPSQIARLPLSSRLTSFLSRAVANVQEDCPQTGMEKRPQAERATLIDWFLLLPTVFSVIAGSRGIVSATLALTDRFSIPHSIAGTLGIAGLTGIPNAIAAIRLATRGRGAAVVTECFNSNTANLFFGICLPALVVGLGVASARTDFSLVWLLAMTTAAMALLSRSGGLRRTGGTVLIIFAGLFAAAVIGLAFFTR